MTIAILIRKQRVSNELKVFLVCHLTLWLFSITLRDYVEVYSTTKAEKSLWESNRKLLQAKNDAKNIVLSPNDRAFDRPCRVLSRSVLAMIARPRVVMQSQWKLLINKCPLFVSWV